MACCIPFHVHIIENRLEFISYVLLFSALKCFIVYLLPLKIILPTLTRVMTCVIQSVNLINMKTLFKDSVQNMALNYICIDLHRQTTEEISFLGSLEDSIFYSIARYFFIRDQYRAAAFRQRQLISEDQNRLQIIWISIEAHATLQWIPIWRP